MNAFIGGYQTGGQTATTLPSTSTRGRSSHSDWSQLSDEDPRPSPESPRVVVRQTQNHCPVLGQKTCPPGLFKWRVGELWYGSFKTFELAKASFGGLPLQVLSTRSRCEFTARGEKFDFESYAQACLHFGGDPLRMLFFTEELTFGLPNSEPDRFRSYEDAVQRYGGCPWEQMKICSHPTEVSRPEFVGPRWRYSMVHVPKVSSGMIRTTHRNGY